MKIDDKIPPIRIDAYIQQTQDKPGRKAPESRNPDPAAKGDTVKLSQTVKDVLKAKDQLKSIPDVREDKVEEVRNQINTGTYKIDGKKIAFNMIRDSLIDEIV